MTTTAPETREPRPIWKRRAIVIPLLLFLLLILGWFTIRPGLFVVQPIGAVPEGRTILYSSRGGDLPFVASADGVCLQKQGNVNLLCRAGAIAGFMRTFEEHILLRLPYSEWLYLQTTEGAKFDR